MAPSPTGYLHLGHASTFWCAQMRAREAGGVLVLRIEDLDGPRCRPEFVDAIFEDLRWFGFRWDEGPDVGGIHAPYAQSRRLDLYHSVLGRLREGGWVYPCSCSRRDVAGALSAPHAGDEEPVYPGTCREAMNPTGGAVDRPCWRFRVPEGVTVEFLDGGVGVCRYLAGRDFGDFVVWRGDGFPSYQLACVVDDAAMGITEVVRGRDLLVSTARQLLLYEALGWKAPGFVHCPLVTDTAGVRLAKRHASLSLRRLREEGKDPGVLRSGWDLPA